MDQLRELLSLLDEIEADPCRRILEAKASLARPVVAYLPPDVPEELIHAAGAIPFAVIGSAPSESHVAAGVPSFLCPPVRIALGKAEHRQLSFADGFVLPYICDSTKALAQVWRPHARGAFTHAVCFPRRGDEGAHSFLAAEFLRLKERLEEATGARVSEAALQASIRLYNENRRLLRQLEGEVREGRSAVGPSQFYGIVRASMLMPKEEHTAWLRDVLRLSAASSGPDETRLRVFLYGYWAEPRGLLADIEHAGMQIVGDNLHDGSRYFEVDVDDGSSLEALARRHFARSPSSCFHCSADRWRQYWQARVDVLGVEGVVCLSPSRCDPMDFDEPRIRGLLEELDVPLLALQTEFARAPDAQAANRIAAFGEVLRGRRDG